MTKLAVILVNYNTRELLQKCLRHLYDVLKTDAKIIVVDSGSTDGSADMVASEFTAVTLIRAENKGISSGYNAGIQAASECDYVLFLGSDAFPKAGCVEGVINYLEGNKVVGVATPRLVLRNGSLDLDAHRGFPRPWTALTHFSGLDKLFPKSRLFNRYFMSWCDMESPHEIDSCISHFMLVKKEVLGKVGPWDEEYFVYGEDVDYCWRTKEAGFKIVYLPQYDCLHYKGVSVGIRKESSDISKADYATKKRMLSESTRAMRLFYKKHMYSKYPKVLNWGILTAIALMGKVRLSKLKT